MKILITGAAGYFGSNLSEYLLSKGHSVVGFDNFNDFYDPRVKEYNIKDLISNEKFNLYRVDITDITKMEEILKEQEHIDAIVHLAAWAGVTRSFDEPSTYVRNNVEGTSTLVSLAINQGIGNFIFASTSGVYGQGTTPFKEDMTTDLPLSPYPATKKACEVLLYSYTQNYDISATVMRIFNPLGPRLRPDLLLPKLIKSCLYGTECPIFWKREDLYNTTGRDYTAIVHMFEFIEYALNNPFKYEIFNLGNSAPVMLGNILDMVEEVVGKKLNTKFMEYRKGEMLVTYADIDKARRLTGYNPITNVKTSISKFFEWFVQQEEWYKRLEKV